MFLRSHWNARNLWYNVRKHPRRHLRMCVWCEWCQRCRSPCFFYPHHLYHRFCILKSLLWTAFHMHAFWMKTTCVLYRVWTVSENVLETVCFQTETYPCGRRYASLDFFGALRRQTRRVWWSQCSHGDAKRAWCATKAYQGTIRYIPYPTRAPTMPRLPPYQVSDLTSHDISRQGFWLAYCKNGNN